MHGLSKFKKMLGFMSVSLLVLAACDSAPAQPTAAPGEPANTSTTPSASTNDNRIPATPASSAASGLDEQSAPLAAFDSPLPAPRSIQEVEFTGAVEVMANNLWMVGGHPVMITAATEIKPGLDIGVLAKVHAVQQVGGSLWAREIEPVSEGASSNFNDNSNNTSTGGSVNANDNDAASGNSNSNTNGNSNDDQGNGNANSNDDNGNDDDGNGYENENDDDGGHGNENDDNGDDKDNGNSNGG